MYKIKVRKREEKNYVYNSRIYPTPYNKIHTNINIGVRKYHLLTIKGGNKINNGRLN